MNSQNPIQLKSADTAEIEMLKAQILSLKAQVDALKFSELDQKAKNEALVVQNQELHRELQTAKAANDALAPMQEQY
jgi:hypothetical protein